MTTREEAVEQLRVIRSMMERATIFRALTGETAMLGGAVALAVAWLSEKRHGWEWAACWLGGLIVVLGFYVFQLIRMKAVHHRPFWSAGLRMALRGALPSLLAGGFMSLLFVRAGNDVAAACMWIVHYGLALLAIREFAPKSMVWLGWAFVVFGVASLASVTDVVHLDRDWLLRVNASRLMAIAFGGFHLVYGALIVTTSRREEPSA
jgi:membrane-bound ClpP family serine protease